MNAFGEAQAWTLGNGLHVQHNYDPGTGTLTNIMAGPGENDASRVSLAYGYGPLGNTNYATNILTGLTRYPGYDGLNRQTQDLVYNRVDGYTTLSTAYDAEGDIARRSGIGTYSYTGAMPHAVTNISKVVAIPREGSPDGFLQQDYTYNDVGQMTSGGDLTQIQWTAGGRAKKIVGSQTLNLAYTADGQLIQKTIADTTSRYFGQLYVKVGDASRARIVANGEVVAIVNVNATGYATTSYMVHDAQGSPAAMFDQSGDLIARFAWNAWGEMVNPHTGMGSDPNAAMKELLTTLGYTGHEMFWKSGLVHTFARLYNPAIGRWLSPDPTVPHPFNGQSFNRFSYVLNNPETFTDPSGLGGDFGQVHWYFDQLQELIRQLQKMVVRAQKISCPSGSAPVLGPYVGNGVGWSYTCLDLGRAGSMLGSSGARVPGLGGGGGFRELHNHNNQHKKENPCGELRQAAAQLAKSLEQVAHTAGVFAGVGGVVTVISGLGEVPTYGGDTEITVSALSVTEFSGVVSLGAGGMAAALKSLASGNFNALNTFGENELVKLIANGVLQRVPGLSSVADQLAELVGQAAELANEAQESCQ